MSNRNFDNSVIIKRLQNQVYARNLYLNNTNGKTVINNPQNSNGDSSQFTSYIPGAQTEYFRGLIGEGETISVGGIVNIPPFPTTPILQPSPVIYNFVTNGLTLYYNFGDSASYPGSGTSVNDLSPNGYTGTLVNGPTFDSVLNGGILILDGISEYINTNNSIASNSFTINTWFKATTNVSVPRMLISKETIPGSPWNYRLYLNNSNGYLIGDIAQVGGDNASIGNSQSLADNTWHLASFSRDETTDKLKLYVDGVLVSELTAGLTGSITNTQDVWIGRSAFDPIFQGGSYPFSGSIGSAFIYNRALTDNEVFTNFMATKTRFEQASGIESFTTVGTTSWTAPTGVTSVQYLVVGGGGGGGGGYDTGGGGGGGGGMVLTGTLSVTPGSTYTITVGAGGAASTNSYPSTPETAGGTGSNSVFSSVTALGGEGGKRSRVQTGASGLGGAAAINPSTASVGGSGGGSGATSAGGSGGGGGGASGPGSNGVSSAGGLGGTGISSSISGSSITYGTGGNGAKGQSQITGANGATNRGQGGSGGAYTSGGASNGGAGGSGIVILKY